MRMRSVLSLRKVMSCSSEATSRKNYKQNLGPREQRRARNLACWSRNDGLVVVGRGRGRQDGAWWVLAGTRGTETTLTFRLPNPSESRSIRTISTNPRLSVKWAIFGGGGGA